MFINERSTKNHTKQFKQSCYIFKQPKNKITSKYYQRLQS